MKIRILNIWRNIFFSFLSKYNYFYRVRLLVNTKNPLFKYLKAIRLESSSFPVSITIDRKDGYSKESIEYLKNNI